MHLHSAEPQQSRARFPDAHPAAAGAGFWCAPNLIQVSCWRVIQEQDAGVGSVTSLDAASLTVSSQCSWRGRSSSGTQPCSPGSRDSSCGYCPTFVKARVLYRIEDSGTGSISPT